MRFNLPGLTARLTSTVQTEQNLSPQIQLAEKLAKELGSSWTDKQIHHIEQRNLQHIEGVLTDSS